MIAGASLWFVVQDAWAVISLMHQSNPTATIPPPRDSKGHSQARLSPHPDICNVVVTRGRGICQQRDITPGHLSLTEKTAATCFRDCVVKMDDFLGQDEAFVASWLENEGLAKLVAIFKGRN